MRNMAPINHQVNIISRQTLQRAHPTSTPPTPSLGPLDFYAQRFIPIQVVYVYEQPNHRFVDLVPTARLRHALSLLLDYYPHLTGRLQTRTSDNAPEVSRIGTGALLLDGTCPSRLDELKSPANNRLLVTDLPDNGNALFAPYNDGKAADGEEPLLVVQRTQFACGGIALGIRLPHVTCDADGFLQFARDLAELYRKLGAGDAKPGLSVPPCTNAYLSDFLDPSLEDAPMARGYRQTMFRIVPDPVEGDTKPMTGTHADESSSAPPMCSPPVTGRVIHLSAQELARIKESASDPTPGSWVSTYEALAAHMYQRVYQARVQLAAKNDPMGKTPAITLLATVNFRGKTHLDLPPHYFNNAGLHSVLSLSAERLFSASLVEIAREIHNHIASLTRVDAKSILRWYAAQADKSRIVPNYSITPGTFGLTQWSKMGMYDGMGMDRDGGGKLVMPSLVSPPFSPQSLIDGLGYVIATGEQMESGGVDVCLALSEPVWGFLDVGLR